MDVTIANFNISIHRNQDQLRPELAVTRAEREANRSQQVQRLEHDREQTLNWYALHGGR